MWKYVTKDISNEFLLSLHLIDEKNDKNYINKIYSISNNIVNNYNIFEIKKNSGGYRKIYEPKSTLKYVQRQILINILQNKKVSKYATAYCKGISLKDNAYPHVGKKIILKLDIRHFFESIGFFDVYNACFSLEYFPFNIGILLTNLVTYYGFLPQGSPTSAYISNLVMKDFDEGIGVWCDENNISYTRYSDDMTFSGDFNPSEIIKIIRKELYKLGLELNNNKIHVIHTSSRQIVTGIVVNEKVQVKSKYRKQIRQEVYYIKKFGIESHLKMIKSNIDLKKYLTIIYGKILFVLQVNKDDNEFKEYKRFIHKLLNNTH